MLTSRIPAGQAPHPAALSPRRPPALLIHALLFGVLLAVAIPARFPSGEVAGHVLATALAAMLLAAAVLAATWILLRSRIRGAPRRSRSIAMEVAAVAACVVAGSAYLAAFYPAVMSYDSLNQWAQLVAFRFNDHHPAAHTLLEWAITRLWFSPAAIALFQILALAALAGAAVRRLFVRGAPLWLGAAFALFQAGQPLNGMYAVTLWKDVPFGAAVFASVLILTSILDSDGRWLERRRHRWLLGTVLVLIALLRHNGVVVAAAIVLALAAVCRAQRARVVVVAAGVAMSLFLVRGPMYDRLGVERGPAVVPVIQAWHLGALVASGAALTAGEQALASEILPLDTWKRCYSPYTVDPLTNAPGFNRRLLQSEEGRARLRAAWGGFARRHPRILLEHLARMSSIAWRIRPFPDGYTMSMCFAIDPNEFGLATSPLSSRLHRDLDALTHRVAVEPGWRVLFCRPALYLVVALFAGAVMVLRSGRRREALVLVPLLATALPLFIYCPCQDTRYLYPVILSAPFLLARAMISDKVRRHR